MSWSAKTALSTPAGQSISLSRRWIVRRSTPAIRRPAERVVEPLTILAHAGITIVDHVGVTTRRASNACGARALTKWEICDFYLRAGFGGDEDATFVSRRGF